MQWLEEVITNSFKMIEYFLKVVDIPWIREPERFDRFHEDPLTGRCHQRNVLPGHVNRDAKTSVLLSSRNK